VNWRNYYQRWADRAGSTGKLGDVSFVLEPWAIPGEAPLQVRACTRAGHPQSSFAKMVETPKTSITLHHTSGYGNFGTLMGDSKGGAHFMIGRDGNAYRLVDTEKVAWHANLWSLNSIGIEVDNPGNLRLKDKTFYDEHDSAYCTKDDEGVWVEKLWPNYGRYWAAWSEEQYAVLGRLLKALCARHGIPRMILPEDRRYKGFGEREKQQFRGVCVHVNVNPDNRDDLGPYVDWARLIRYAGLSEGDCFGLGPAGPEPEKPPKKSTAPSAPGKSAAPAKKSESTASPGRQKALPPPQLVDAHTVRVSVGARPGRISLTVKAAGEELKPAPKGVPPAPPADADGKRDKFIAAALSYKGTPYQAGSDDPGKGGLDGPGLIALCLKKVGVKLDHDKDKPLDGPALAAHFPPVGGDPEHPPAEIIPGDIAWFGEGDHDHGPTQHATIWLGRGKVLGPRPGSQDEHHGAVQVLAIKEVGEKFAGFSHLDELGKAFSPGEAHPAHRPPRGASVTAALLPADPDALYEALAGVVKDAGGKWESGAGKVNLVGVTDLVDGVQISPLPNGWNDTLFAAWVDSDGHRHVIDARASINPGHDADPAGSWHLLDGSYTFKLDRNALVPDGTVRGWRDEKGAGTPRPQEGPAPSTEGDIACNPPLRALAQYDERLNDHPIQGDSKTWQGNACHPTSVTMVFRWIADKGRFKFPRKEGSQIPPHHYHRRLMEAFWPDLGGQMPGTSKDDIPHGKLIAKAQEALGMKAPPKLAFPGTSVEKRLPVLRRALARGPVVIGIPDHYVVLQAIVGEDMLICDPGNVLSRKWFTEDGSPLKRAGSKQAGNDSCGMPPPESWNGEKVYSDRNGLMYVRVPIYKKVKRPAYPGHGEKRPGLLIEMLSDHVGAESYWWEGGE
jgi:cell wall-associated NlpC family hydrolase